MKKKAKGFTLVELIIVLAILGVLTAVIVPAWMNYIADSKIKKQNNFSKVVFNAAQTVTQEYKFSERNVDPANRNVGEGEFYFIWDGTRGYVCNAVGADAGASATFNQTYADAVNKIFSGSDSTVYKIYVHDYIVQSVATGRSYTDHYMGSYPVMQEEYTNNNIRTFDLKTVDLT